MTSRSIVALIVAAGRGSRAGSGGPKQYRPLAGRSVLARTVEAFLTHPEIAGVRVVIHRDDDDLYAEALGDLRAHRRLMTPVHGGAERQDSVRLGLQSFAADVPDLVLIHDAARPFIDGGVISRVVEALGRSPGAIAALPVHDTLKRADDAGAQIEGTIDRARLWRAQTPQGFRFDAILAAHEAAAGKNLTDDAAVAEAAGMRVALVPGAPDNMKITQAEDFGMAEILLTRRKSMAEYRTGQGFDVHQFEPGVAVILCGVAIPHDGRLKGHSDADAAMHALTDAILGAVGEGDIGDHFPPTDAKWRGAPSRIFLEKACALVRERGGDVTHCDITIICEAPKIKPHRLAMREALSEIMNVSVDRISVKATTTEELGFTGRREGIAAMATATVRLPEA